MTISQWQRKRWLVPSLVETIVLSTGASSYTIGATGDFPVARPDRIESAYARLLPGTSIAGTVINGGVLTIPPGSSLPTSPTGLSAGAYWNNGGVVCVVAGVVAGASQSYIDYPLSIIEAQEDYNAIALKALTTFPAAVFYLSAYPTGTLYFWPVPTAATFELHVFTKSSLPIYTSLTSLLNLPAEYFEALLYSLAVRLAMNYGIPARPDHVAAMSAALATIRNANLQPAVLGMPGAVLPRRGGSVAASQDPRFQTGWW